MDVLDAARELKHHFARLKRREIMAAHDIEFVAEGPAIDVFVRHVGPPIDHALAIDLDDVGVIERGRGDAFTVKTLDILRVSIMSTRMTLRATLRRFTIS
jgi:hypothetical protein